MTMGDAKNKWARRWVKKQRQESIEEIARSPIGDVQDKGGLRSKTIGWVQVYK